MQEKTDKEDLINGKDKVFAVLIDAENTSHTIMESLINKVNDYGRPCLKRVYGDFTSKYQKGWKDVIISYGLTPFQQFSCTSGKNAADCAMIVDAMDLLYTNQYDGFCIVSSDSDYTKLALRIRESGALVLGFGEKKTPKSFVKSCDEFIYVEEFIGNSNGKKERQQNNRPVIQKSILPKDLKNKKESLKKDKNLVKLLRKAIENTADDEGWADLPDVEKEIDNISTSFNLEDYGYVSLDKLIKDIDIFEFKIKLSSGKQIFRIFSGNDFF